MVSISRFQALSSHAHGVFFFFNQTGLFVFNLSDGVPLRSPLLTAFDLCLQMFVNILQLVSGSMLWRLRNNSRDPPLLAGLQRAGVVVMLLQLVLTIMFGFASDNVLYRPAYFLSVAIYAICLLYVCNKIWRTDILNHRVDMLRTAIWFNFASLVSALLYGMLLFFQGLDAWELCSERIRNAVFGNALSFGASVVAVFVLTLTMRFWIHAGPGQGINPLSLDSLKTIQFWNLVVAFIGLIGPPVTIPSLIVVVFTQSTEVNPLDPNFNPDKPDIFYVSKTDRFSLDY